MRQEQKKELPEKYKNLPKEKRSVVLPTIILVMLSIRLAIFLVEYSQDYQPLDITHDDWINTHPNNNWLNISEVKADLINTFYVESMNGGKELFIPLISADSTVENSETHLILCVTHGPIYSKMAKKMRLDEDKIVENFLNNPDDFLIDGPFQGYQYDGEASHSDYVEVVDNLATNYKVIQLYETFPYIPMLVIAGICIALLAYILLVNRF